MIFKRILLIIDLTLLGFLFIFISFEQLNVLEILVLNVLTPFLHYYWYSLFFKLPLLLCVFILWVYDHARNSDKKQKSDEDKFSLNDKLFYIDTALNIFMIFPVLALLLR
jgi:membrane protein implicated in regulation of membrane protease activity